MEIIASNLEKHVKFLTDNIGVRLAGSIEEEKAAEYIAKEFSKLAKQGRPFFCFFSIKRIGYNSSQSELK